MRDPEGRPPLSMTVRLMIALVAAFALVQVATVYFGDGWMKYLPLSLTGIRGGQVWQLLTFQFVHAGLFHLAGNLLGLWFCGRFVEHVLGRWRFLGFYLGTGVMGGLLHLALAALAPGVFDVAVYGASAGVMALVALFCLLQPEAEFLLMFIVRIKAKHLLIAETAIALFFTLVPADRGVAHAAHLGGILGAMLFFRMRWHDELTPLPGADWIQRLQGVFRRQKLRPARPAVARSAPERRSAPAKVIEFTPEEFMAREVDPILEKIAAHGIESLTAKERATLERARANISKR